MKIDLRNKDFWAGIMLIGIGAASIFFARGYPFGSTIRMGPGYFPSMLGGILVLFGIYVMVMGLRSGEKILSRCSLRALIVLPLSVVAFGVLMNHAGFIPALVVLIRVGVRGQGIQVRRGSAAYRDPDRAFGRRIHLGPWPAVPIDQGLLTTASWNSSTT